MMTSRSDPSPKLALVTGGRHFRATAATMPALDAAFGDVALVIEGEALGFDRLVRERAHWHDIQVQPCPAYWRLAGVLKHRLKRPIGAEGPIRNARMLRWGRELAEAYGVDLVLLAGVGGTGTADMRKICNGLPVREIPGELAR
jgi:hypothetical protein